MTDQEFHRRVWKYSHPAYTVALVILPMPPTTLAAFQLVEYLHALGLPSFPASLLLLGSLMAVMLGWPMLVLVHVLAVSMLHVYPDPPADVPATKRP